MNMLEALKVVAPAVGDGRLVRAHSYVCFWPPLLHATDGSQWAAAAVDDMPSDSRGFCVRHDMLLKAMDRDGATLTIDGQNVRVQAGRSRTTLKGIPVADWPMLGPVSTQVVFTPPDGFKDLLRDLNDFCGGGDAHTWQQGVHFRNDMAFAANPFGAICFNHHWQTFHFAVPPWATRFILGQDESPATIQECGNVLKFTWPEFSLVTTKLNEEPSEAIENFVRTMEVPDEAHDVPANLKEAVERVKAYGEKQFSLGNGVLERVTDTVEIVDDVDITSAPKIWGVDTMLAALKHAEGIDLTGTNAVWFGRGYTGMFSGISR
jgi:hypothetical protein